MATAKTSAAPNFDAIFAADVEPRRAPFTVAGKPAWVDLLPMSGDDLTRFEQMSMEYVEEDGKYKLIPRTNVDHTETVRFLISRTVVGWETWERPRLADGKLGDWQMTRTPDDTSRLVDLVAEKFCSGGTPQFTNWLAGECLTANGLNPGQQGKSEASSGS